MSISSVPYSLVCVLRMNPTVCQFHWFWRFWAFGHFLLACSSFNVNLFVHEILKTYIHTYVYIYVTNTGNWKLYSADSLWRSGVYWVNMYVAKKKGCCSLAKARTVHKRTNGNTSVRTVWTLTSIIIIFLRLTGIHYRTVVFNFCNGIFTYFFLNENLLLVLVWNVCIES